MEGGGGEGNLPGEPTCLSRELSGAAAVEGWGAGAFQLWDRIWGIPGLGDGTERLGREGLGMPKTQGAELKLVSCVLGTGPALSPTSARVGGGRGPGENLSSLQPGRREET